MSDITILEDLKKRVLQFHCLELPGQPQMMHVGTSNLVNDLWQKIQELLKEKSK